MSSAIDQTDRMKIFVSYSRDDVTFADQLSIGLESVGFDPILDRHNIDAAENWRERLGKLILSADAVAFVLTDSSAASAICAWEVEEAKRLAKRIIPVVPREVNAIPPQTLADLNWIYFFSSAAIPGSGMFDGLRKLERALRVDLEWLREQTRLSERAEEWRGEPTEDRLLRGAAIKAALDWMGRLPKSGSVPDSVREYLTASADAEQRRDAAAAAEIAEREQAVRSRDIAVRELSRRTAIGMAGAGVLFVGGGGLAVWGNSAEKRFNDERKQRILAEAQSAAALAQAEGTRPNLAGRLVALASGSDSLAEDGGSSGSPYTRAILTELNPGAVSLQSALLRGSRRVLEETQFRQRPFLSTDMNGEVYFDIAPPERKKMAIVLANDGRNLGLPLEGPQYDFSNWKAFLEKCSFEVKALFNPSVDDVINLLYDLREPDPKRDGQSNFEERPSKGLRRMPASENRAERFLFVFYSGLGFSSKGEQYLPLDVKPHDMDSIEVLRSGSLPLSTLNELGAEAAKAVAIVLDTGFPDPEYSTQ